MSIDRILEWYHLLPYATATFNWFPNEHSQESPHFLYFRCDPYLPHFTAFLQPKLRYLGSDEGMMQLDKCNMGHKICTNIRVVKLIGPRQLKVADPISRLRKVNISDIHKVLPVDFIVSCIPDEQVFARKANT